MAKFRGIRQALTSWVPSWLSNRPNLNVGFKLLYAIAVQYDYMLEIAREGVRAWMPGISLGLPTPETLDASTALPFIGRSRGLVQGFAESAASFANRCTLWLDFWYLAGRPGGVLLQLLGYVAPTTPMARQVSNNSIWHSYLAGTLFQQPLPRPTIRTGAPNWKWDSAGPPFAYPFAWWRVWYILFSDPSVGAAPWPAPWITSGMGFPSGSVVCGFAGTQQQANAIMAIVKTWKPQRIVAEVLIAYDATMYDPNLAFGSSKLPDGTWGDGVKLTGSAHVGIGVQAVPSRPSNTSFFGKVY